jgi:hypothetical protein
MRAPTRRPGRALVAVAAIGAAIVAMSGLSPRAARADGLAELPTARAVGRAGTGLVSDDGAGAVLLAPAGLARRDVARGQLGALVVDHDLTFDADEPVIEPERPADTRLIVDRSEPLLAPLVAVQRGVGPVVLGAAFATTAERERRLPVPLPDELEADVVRLFPHRYAGMSSSVRRRAVALAAAWRATDWLAVGAGASLSRVEIAERRRLWAGFLGRSDDLSSDEHDIEVMLDGHDAAVPAVTLSALIAPASAPLEIAVAIGWSDAARIDGRARASSDGTAAVTARAAARLDIAAPWTARAGVRWLGERWAAELGADLWILPDGVDAPGWRLDGLVATDVTGVTAAIDDLPSRLAQRSHGALRGALDLEVLEGFVWLTGGWAWSGAAVPDDRLSPTFADLGGHTAAVGVEVTAGGFTVAGGWSRSFTASHRTRRGAAVRDNPFDAGTVPSSAGRYDTARDAIGISLELALE